MGSLLEPKAFASPLNYIKNLTSLNEIDPTSSVPNLDT